MSLSIAAINRGSTKEKRNSAQGGKSRGRTSTAHSPHTMKTLRSTITLVALIATLSTSVSFAGPADERAIAQLARTLNTVTRTYTARGYYLHDMSPAFLRRGAMKDMTVNLNRGEHIVIRGAGDSDASDVDIAVFGPDGRCVARDTDYDANPCVQFRAPRTGRYTVRIGLVSCASYTNGSYVALVLAEK